MSAALAHADRRVRTLSLSFLRAAQPGPAGLRVDTVRSGSSSAVVRVAVEQDGHHVVEGAVTSMRPHPDALDGWSTPMPDGPPPIDRCTHLPTPPSVGHFVHARAVVAAGDLPADIVTTLR